MGQKAGRRRCSRRRHSRWGGGGVAITVVNVGGVEGGQLERLGEGSRSRRTSCSHGAERQRRCRGWRSRHAGRAHWRTWLTHVCGAGGGHAPKAVGAQHAWRERARHNTYRRCRVASRGSKKGNHTAHRDAPPGPIADLCGGWLFAGPVWLQWQWGSWAARRAQRRPAMPYGAKGTVQFRLVHDRRPPRRQAGWTGTAPMRRIH